MEIKKASNEKKKTKFELSPKKKKVILFSAIGVLAATTIALSGVLIYKSVNNGYIIGDNRNNYAIDEYHASKNNKKYEYLNSLKLEDVELQTNNGVKKADVNAHSFLIGKVKNVPFYASAGVKFEYDETAIRVSYSQINMETISSTLAYTTSKSENMQWQDTDKYDENFKASADLSISKFKAHTEFSISHGITRVEGGSLSTVYTSSNEETISSCEAFQKSSDYSISMKTSNGFEKGKYYRLTLQQSVSMYMTVYELPASSTNDQPRYYYEVNNFLDDPMDYSMIIEKSDDQSFKESESAKFDKDIYEDCIYYIENNKLVFDDKPTHEELVASVFKHANSVDSDVVDDKTIVTDVTSNEFDAAHTAVVPFERLFESKNKPTLNDLLNNGQKNVDVTIDMEAKMTGGNAALDIAIVRSVDYFTKVLQLEFISDIKTDVSRKYYLELKGIQLKDIAKDLTVAFKLQEAEEPSNDNGWKIESLNVSVRVYK